MAGILQNTSAEDELTALLPPEIIGKAGGKQNTDENGNTDPEEKDMNEYMKKNMGAFMKSEDGKKVMREYMKNYASTDEGKEYMRKMVSKAAEEDPAFRLELTSQALIKAAEDLGGQENSDEDIDLSNLLQSFQALAKAAESSSEQSRQLSGDMTGRLERIETDISGLSSLMQKTAVVVLKASKSINEIGNNTILPERSAQPGAQIESVQQSGGGNASRERLQKAVDEFTEHYGKDSQREIEERLTKAAFEDKDAVASDILGYVSLARDPSQWINIGTNNVRNLDRYLKI